MVGFGISCERIYELPISKLKTSKFNVRKSGALNDINDLTTNIAKIGVKNPIIVHEYRKNNYEVISGQRRYIAARKAGLKTIPCIIRKNVEPIDMIIESFSENLFRSEMSMIDKGKAAVAILKKCNGDKNEVAKVLGVHISTVRRYLEADSLSTDMKEHLSQGMNFATAQTIYRKSPNDERQRKKLSKAYMEKSKKEKSDFYNAIKESDENDTLENVEKNFRKKATSKTINLRLPSRENKYVEDLAKEKNIGAQQVILELITIGIMMHKSGRVRI